MKLKDLYALCQHYCEEYDFEDDEVLIRITGPNGEHYTFEVTALSPNYAGDVHDVTFIKGNATANNIQFAIVPDRMV